MRPRLGDRLVELGRPAVGGIGRVARASAGRVRGDRVPAQRRLVDADAEVGVDRELRDARRRVTGPQIAFLRVTAASAGAARTSARTNEQERGAARA